MLSLDDAIRVFRSEPKYQQLVQDAYLGADTLDSARRFVASSEFKAVLDLLGKRIQGATVLDLGAGVGIGAYAFCQHGAKQVYALEPDTSPLVGIGAMNHTIQGLPVNVIQSVGETVPLPDACIDIYYTRQVLHHTRDLKAVLREAYRVLKPNGVFLACREHVANTPEELAIFLANHPTHQLAGGENAYRLDEYTGAIEEAGFKLQYVWGAWDSLINTFPKIQSQAMLDQYPETLLSQRFGVIGQLVSKIPPIRALAWQRISRRHAGDLHTFFAIKQA